MLVQQILNSKGFIGILTVTPSAKISEVASILAEKHIGGLIVSKDGKSADGIISERDIVRAVAESGSTCLDFEVSNVMTKDPKTCALDEKVDAILQRMTRGRFRHMPVVDNGEMVGIVTIGDVVAAQLSDWSMEKDALQGMITGH